MNSLINLVISFVLAILFGQQTEEPKTANYEGQNDPIEIFETLECRQQVLEC
ncbi:hypothetical protein ML462_06485 [Gramella lutea]|uniref:Uncharacterized protein n=1 Tax=Christiangramia lutea TaxID=1607951 RepID=A0A9X1V2V6_9FLAO|nr:hypothetical protein [Christiangramia lutea]MCH4822815.1 hypothetical protein [Christiangramia lutea]